MYHAIAPRAVGGLFGCDIDKAKFPLVNVYPGRQNMWVVARRAGASGTVDGVVKDWLKPLDTTAWLNPTSNVPFAIQQEDAAGIRFYAEKMQVSVAQNVNTFVNKADFLGNTPQFFVVLFNPPADSPSSMPWPVIGCPEEADWVLLYVMTSKPKQVVPDTSSGPVETSQEAVEARRKAAELALLDASNLDSGSSGASKWWLLAGLTAVGAAGYYVLRRTGRRGPLRPVRS